MAGNSIKLRKTCFGFLLLAILVFSSLSQFCVADEQSEAVFTELDGIFEKARIDLKAPSLVYGVVANGELAHSGAFGMRHPGSHTPVDAQTAYRIASMTKMMTALLVLDLQDQGKLYLDAPAETYVPQLASLTYPTTDSRKITVRDLLNHTAGFVTDDPWADRQMARSRAELDAFLAQAQPFSFAPGETFEYSNLGFTILGRVIENVSGQSFGEQLDDRLIKPLEMNSTTLDFNALPAQQRAGAYNWVDDEYIVEPILESGAFDPLGGIWTTVEDYGKFVTWFISAWPPRNDPENSAIPRRVVRSVTNGVHMFGVRKSGPGLNSADDCPMASAYSMGLGMTEHCDAGLILSHGGGFPGYGTYVMMMPEKGIGVFAFANETYADSYAPVWDATRLLVDSDLVNAPDGPEASDRLLAAYGGVFKAYSASDIQAGGLSYADNFFLDRSAQRWAGQLDELKAEAGVCASSELNPYGRLSGGFEWQCESARIAGSLTLAPVNPGEVQKLHLRIIRRDSSGGELVTDFDFH